MYLNVQHSKRFILRFLLKNEVPWEGRGGEERRGNRMYRSSSFECLVQRVKFSEKFKAKVHQILSIYNFFDI